MPGDRIDLTSIVNSQVAVGKDALAGSTSRKGYQAVSQLS
jgi:hypothetical protein